MTCKIEIRIRDEYESASRHLCTWPATDLDNLIPTLRRWSVETDDGPQETFAGQFRHDESGSYFEVMICDAGDREDDES